MGHGLSRGGWGKPPPAVDWAVAYSVKWIDYALRREEVGTDPDGSPARARGAMGKKALGKKLARCVESTALRSSLG
jgi:hypothetical protein